MTLTVTDLKDVPRVARVLKESQLREYRRLVGIHGEHGATAIFRRDLIFRNGNAWWSENRSAVLAELTNQREETK